MTILGKFLTQVRLGRGVAGRAGGRGEAGEARDGLGQPRPRPDEGE